MKDAVLIHSPQYANWVFSSTHPTQGRRFINARNQFLALADKLHLDIDEKEPRLASSNELALVHDPTYIYKVLVHGSSGEWGGRRSDLGEIAQLMAGGTLTALESLLDQESLLAINFAGAKHHAMRDHSSGFCVFADFSVAATIATSLGHRVAIFDCDAHHGDGTEALLEGNDDVLTYSVHQYGIFPFTGGESDSFLHTYNYPLAWWCGDKDLGDATTDFIRKAYEFEPTMIFIACGADGLKDDPLSDLSYSVNGYWKAMRSIRQAFPDLPILLGGAGGYLPDSGTPEVWANAGIALSSVSAPINA